MKAKIKLPRFEKGDPSHESSLSPQVIYEDNDIICLFKKRGVHSVILNQSDPITVADQLIYLDEAQANASPNPLEGGLVQRLDFHTSGICLAAKNLETWVNLHAQLIDQKSSTEKKYFALVEGKVISQLITTSILLKKNSKSVSVVDPGYEPRKNEKLYSARTEVNLHQYFSFDNVSLVEVSASHLTRHQVRAHLASVGAPLIGDELYGSKLKLSELNVREYLVSTEGFFLFASELSVLHPKTEKRLRLLAEPDEFTEQIVSESN